MKSDDGESRRGSIINFVGIALVVACYVGALLNMLKTQQEDLGGTKKIIRICHWQLESGWREGVQHAIDEFEKINPDVKVIQLPIYERAFTQFVKTQLIGGTAPDMLEMEFFDGGGQSRMLGRYFVPLSPYLGKPNEYNADNELKDVPWIYTIRDALSDAMSPSDLEYYSVGICTYTGRLMYNKQLYRKIMNTDTLPTDFRGFLAMCKTVVEYGKKQGVPIYPIAAANYQVNGARNTYYNALTTHYAMDMIDLDRMNGGYGYLKLTNYCAKTFSFDEPQLKAAEECAKEIAQYYQPGFMAQNRMESGFAFAQQRAVMINSGSWDYKSLYLQAKDNGFDIGVFNFPLPSKDDPVYGKFVLGKTAEQVSSGSRFGITRFSKHPDIAIKFLKFLTSQKINSEINEVMWMVPPIRGAKVSDHMKPWVPDETGFPSISDQNLKTYAQSTKSVNDDANNYWEYISGVTSFDQFIAATEKRYIPDMMYDAYQDLLNQFDSRVHNDMCRSLYFVRGQLASDSAERATDMKKFIGLSSTNASTYMGIIDRGYQFYYTGKLDNDRAKKLANVAEYKQLMEKYAFDAK